MTSSDLLNKCAATLIFLCLLGHLEQLGFSAVESSVTQGTIFERFHGIVYPCSLAAVDIIQDDKYMCARQCLQHFPACVAFVIMPTNQCMLCDGSYTAMAVDPASLVYLYLPLRHTNNDKSNELQVPEGFTVGGVFRLIGIPEGDSLEIIFSTERCINDCMSRYIRLHASFPVGSEVAFTQNTYFNNGSMFGESTLYMPEGTIANGKKFELFVFIHSSKYQYLMDLGSSRNGIELPPGFNSSNVEDLHFASSKYSMRNLQMVYYAPFK